MPVIPDPLPIRAGTTASTLLDVELPTVFTGLHDAWPARTRWTIDGFRRDYGDLQVPVRQYEPGAEYDYTVTGATLGEFLEYWQHTEPDAELARTRSYLAEWNFVRDAPALLDDFDIPPLFGDDWIDRLPEQVRFGRMWLFFGEPGCSTGLHCDTFSTSAWLAVLSGAKTLRFVTPAASGALRPGDSLWADDACERLLGAPGGRLYEVTLRPGDTLYIPGDWYHEVRNPERNLMLTANFVEGRKLLSFLAGFESRLTEPIDVLRRTRNDNVTQSTAELDDPDFRASQLEWIRERTADLRAYERVLLDWRPDRPGVDVASR